MKIQASCPVRIDLAGGTLDIFPLYIFEEGGLTINIAISLRSYVEIKSRKDFKFKVHSQDLNDTLAFNNLREVKPKGESPKGNLPKDNLDLIIRAVKFYKPLIGLSIKTRNTCPLGSGLGGSSSLLMALSAALCKINNKKVSYNNLIDWGSKLEAQSLGIPTGFQDYFAALYGGVNAIWFDIDKIKVEPLIKDVKKLKELQKHLILSYTGVSHFSGSPNWNMFRKYVDGSRQTRKSMEKIKETAFQMRESLINFNIEKLAGVLNKEWENRKKLAKGVSNSKINLLMKEARKAGAWAGKICGAGSGGCIITVAPPEKRKEVEKALIRNGAEVLDFSIESKGLLIREYREHREYREYRK